MTSSSLSDEATSTAPEHAALRTRAWTALALAAEGRTTGWLALARNFGDASVVVAATDAELAARGASKDAIAALREAWHRGSAGTVAVARRRGLSIAALPDDDYPALLREIADPPLVLFWRGRSPATCVPAVAIVGARRCTAYGERTAERLAAELAASGVFVASGLARGVDAAAHRGALSEGSGRTVAVLAGGLDHIYPGEHRGLAERIAADGGCLLSEQAVGVRPRPWLFPYRNRIVTGLSVATVIVEAGLRSGSLISARLAGEQGRDVFAVPGPIDSAASTGTNSLLGQGAAPLCNTVDLRVVSGLADLVEDKRSIKLKKQKKIEAALGPDEGRVLAALRAGSTTADEVAAATRLDGTRVLTLLTALELEGLVHREVHGGLRAASPGC